MENIFRCQSGPRKGELVESFMQRYFYCVTTTSGPAATQLLVGWSSLLGSIFCHQDNEFLTNSSLYLNLKNNVYCQSCLPSQFQVSMFTKWNPEPQHSLAGYVSFLELLQKLQTWWLKTKEICTPTFLKARSSKSWYGESHVSSKDTKEYSSFALSSASGSRSSLACENMSLICLCLICSSPLVFSSQKDTHIWIEGPPRYSV